MLNLYKITQNKNTGYDVYSGFVIAAKSELEAKNIALKATDFNKWNTFVSQIKDIKCQLIGEYKFKTPKIILADFHAG